ncbi:MAG: ABC transporter substrate-binding protein [Nitrospinota bacterium]|nr:MAG: ABC transporter substrate-binding protein [Nitrospinota bacterium]
MRTAIRLAGHLGKSLLVCLFSLAVAWGTPPDQVRLRLDWTPWSLHTFLFVAQKHGFFAEENLKVNIYVPSNPEDTLKLVAVGQDHFGLSYQTDTILARAAGIPVVSIAALVQHPLNVLMALKDAGIRSPADLKGKKIGSPLIPSDDVYLETVAQRVGLSKDDYKVVDVGFNLVPSLLSGQVDAVIGAYFVWEKVQIELEGKEVVIFRLQDYGVPDFYESVLLTSEKLLRTQPDLVRRFMRAAVRGMRYTIAHPEEALAILLERNPDLRPELARRALHALIPLMQDGVPKLGWQTAEKWQRLQDYMYTHKLLRKKTPVAEMFTNDYLP